MWDVALDTFSRILGLRLLPTSDSMWHFFIIGRRGLHGFFWICAPDQTYRTDGTLYAHIGRTRADDDKSRVQIGRIRSLGRVRQIGRPIGQWIGRISGWPDRTGWPEDGVKF